MKHNHYVSVNPEIVNIEKFKPERVAKEFYISLLNTPLHYLLVFLLHASIEEFYVVSFYFQLSSMMPHLHPLTP